MIARIVTAMVGVVVLGIPLGLKADEPPCVLTDIRGVDSETKTEIQSRLASELGIPIAAVETEKRCLSLQIIFEETAAVMHLSDGTALHTTLRLDDVPKRHWPRAVALSAAGLLVRHRNSATASIEHKSDPIPPDTAAPHPPVAETEANRETEANHAASTEAADKSVTQRNRPAPQTNTFEAAPSSEYELSLTLRSGGRVMTRFPAFVGDAAVGIHMTFKMLALGLAAVGLFGGRAVDLGRIYTTGGGLDVSLRWQLVDSGRFHLLLGPAVEALAVYGYAREITSAKTTDLLAPAVTVRFLIETGVDLGARLRLSVTAAGGYNAVHVILEERHKAVSGLSGAYVAFAVGLEVAH